MITTPSIWGSLTDLANNGVFEVAGAGAPAALIGAGITGPGSTYTDSLTGNVYVNTGTLAAPVWSLIYGPTAGIQQLSGVITPANIIGTSAGQLGHANGVILIPALGTHFTIELVSVVAHFKFIVAAYTGGGNMTINQGAGGAAITGLVSAANSLNNAASKSVTFVPLSTAAIPNVENGPINMVVSAAPTNPGTAAGTVTWYANFRVYPTGF